MKLLIYHDSYMNIGSCQLVSYYLLLLHYTVIVL